MQRTCGHILDMQDRDGPLWSSSFAHLVVHFFMASALTWNDLKNLEPIVTDYHIEQLDNNSVYIAQTSYIGT